MACLDRMHRPSAPDNRSYLETLAESLVAKLGFDGAARACRSNTWDGILEFVLLFEDDRRED